MQDIFSVPIEILQLNNLDNDLLVNYAKKKYNSSKKYENCFSYDIELQDLKSVVLQSAEKFSISKREGNFNNEIFKVLEIIPMSDHTATVIMKKNTDDKKFISQWNKELGVTHINVLAAVLILLKTFLLS